MRIVELTAFHVHIPLRMTVRHASHSRSNNDTLVVRCRLDNGTEGWGEGLPRPYVTGETIESAKEHLRAASLRRQLAEPFADLAGAVQLAERLEMEGAGNTPRRCFGNAARCAVELSLLDAAARADHVPLSRVTELVPGSETIRKPRNTVRYSVVVTTPKTPARELLRAVGLRLFGFQQIKVKVGMPDVDDATRLRTVRRGAGPKVDLRVDANEAWPVAELQTRIERLMPYRITSVEQPVPHDQLDSLAGVRGTLPAPIMLDESLCSLEDARYAVERRACDLFNIRISKCGGYVNSVKLAVLAHAAGLGYQLGCQVGETGILSAAGRHFASSVANIRYLEGSYERHLVKERLTQEDLTFGRGGIAPALTGPGLGVEIDTASLARVTVAEEHWTLN